MWEVFPLDRNTVGEKVWKRNRLSNHRDLADAIMIIIIPTGSTLLSINILTYSYLTLPTLSPPSSLLTDNP